MVAAQSPGSYLTAEHHGVGYISSWVDLEFRRCFQVTEAESEAMLKEWTDNWDDLIEFEIVPLLNICGSRKSDRG